MAKKLVLDSCNHNPTPEIKSVTVESIAPDIWLNGDDLPFLTIPQGQTYTVELSMDGEGVARLQKALGEIPRTEKEQDLHDIKTMHEVMACPGKMVKDKIDSYLDKKTEEVNNKAKAQQAKKNKNAPKCSEARYRIRHH